MPKRAGYAKVTIQGITSPPYSTFRILGAAKPPPVLVYKYSCQKYPVRVLVGCITATDHYFVVMAWCLVSFALVSSCYELSCFQSSLGELAIPYRAKMLSAKLPPNKQN